VVGYDIKSSLLLLSAAPTQATGPLATLLVDLTVPLLGQTPALKDLRPQDSTYSRAPQPIPQQTRRDGRERESLSLERGTFVTVVGWLESDQSNISSQVS
jgi:hypothetical protein